MVFFFLTKLQYKFFLKIMSLLILKFKITTQIKTLLSFKNDNR